MSFSSCPRRDELLRLVSGELVGDEVTELFRHLDSCHSCERALAEINGNRETLQSGPRASARTGSDGILETASFVAPPLPVPIADEDRVGPYRIIRKLGQGGMGVVYVAEHVHMRRKVALKLLPNRNVVSAASAARFAREIEAAGRVIHPNVVTAYDGGVSGGHYFLAMELIDGEDLSSICRGRPLMSVVDACRIIRQAALGLHEIHRHSLVHRDIKPSNLLLDRSGVVKVLDMGLARIESNVSEENQLTATGQVMGTIDFMAPEQALDTRNADCRADVYSLGMTLWYLLTGHTAFRGDSAMAKLLAHRDAPIPSLCTERPDVSPRLDAIFAKMVAKEPNDRYQDMREVIEAIDEHLNEDGKDVASDSRDMRVDSVLKPSRSHRALMGLLAASIAAIGFVAAAQLQRSTSHQDTTTGSAPARAKAPFDATAATNLQNAWASYLGQPNERAVDLGSDVSLVMVLIPPGEFLMGSNAEEQQRFLAEPSVTPEEKERSLAEFSSEGAQHPVAITTPYWLGKHEVTRTQFRQFVKASRYKTQAETTKRGGWGTEDGVWRQDPKFVWTFSLSDNTSDQTPVVNVSWDDAQAFCRWLSSHDGHYTYSLPTEAQWEFACRAGTETSWFSGEATNSIIRFGWSDPHSNQRLADVGKLNPNALGLFDMHGNASEWCFDWYAAVYDSSSRRENPDGPASGTAKATRGGSWFNTAKFCRSASRAPLPPDLSNHLTGFRIVASVPPISVAESP